MKPTYLSLAVLLLLAARVDAQHQPRDASTPADTAEARPAPSDAGAKDAPADTSSGKPDPSHTAAPTDSGKGRARDGKPASGTAVPRTQPPPDKNKADGGSSGPVIVGGTGDYGYGGYYGGYYDPYDPERSYPDPASSGYRYQDGKLRLKVNPRNATVFVDGYYTGIVDDFDGFFQSLRIEAGPHRVELKDPKYETMAFDVQIAPDRMTTYRGRLKKTQKTK